MTDPAPARRKSPGLGRGLSALLGEAAPQPGEVANDGPREIPIALILADPDQPRRHFDDAALEELAESIRAHGVLQPIVVRQRDAHDPGNGFQIVAGERRWRAAQRVGLRTMPAIVRDFALVARLEVALIENIQREQLNAVEEGEAYRRLIVNHGHSADGLAKQLGKSRSHVTNLMRLVDLPDPVRAMIADGRLSMGHARAMVGHPEAESLATDIVTRGLSVRDAETLAKRGKRVPSPSKPKVETNHAAAPVDSDTALLERHLGDVLGLDVLIKQAGEAGSVTVSFASFDQLDMICQRLTGGAI